MTIIEALVQLRNDLKTWVANNLRTKVDKEDGKGLSSNDFTNEDKAKLNDAATKGYVDNIATTKMDVNKIVVSSNEPTSPIEGLIWIDTSVESITSAEGASF